LADAAILAQLAARHQVGEVPNATPGANAAAFVEYGGGVGKISKRIGHESRNLARQAADFEPAKVGLFTFEKFQENKTERKSAADVVLP
jgi:hypothetical protein